MASGVSAVNAPFVLRIVDVFNHRLQEHGAPGECEARGGCLEIGGWKEHGAAWQRFNHFHIEFFRGGAIGIFGYNAHMVDAGGGFVECVRQAVACMDVIHIPVDTEVFGVGMLDVWRELVIGVGGIWYTSHFWVIDCRDICVECSFTVAKGGDKTVAENIIASIEIRSENKAYPKEIIPIRVLEIGEVNSAYEWASSTIKKQLTKDFSSQEEDIEKIQEVMDSGRFQPQQRMAWENFGVAFGTILVNEMEGMEWVTVIDGKEEYPALQFMNSDMLIDPAAIVWNKAKKNLPCDLKAEFKKIKREAEAVLDDIN
mgnify:CR=1 FL=1